MTHRIIKASEWDLEVLTQMAMEYQDIRVARLQALKNQDQKAYDLQQVITCIHARVIAIYVLDMYLAQVVQADKS